MAQHIQNNRGIFSADHNLTPKNVSYEEVSQWNGKEMKEITQ
jgi:hypothetical protein